MLEFYFQNSLSGFEDFFSLFNFFGSKLNLKIENQRIKSSKVSKQKIQVITSLKNRSWDVLNETEYK